MSNPPDASKQPNKLEIASFHVDAAIRMIGRGINPYSVHLQVMASDEIIEAVAEARDVLLPYGTKLRIKDKYRREWFAAKRKAYNFVKHATRDPESKYDGPDRATLLRLNDMTLAMSINGLRELKHEIPQMFVEYVIAVFVLYPELCKWEELFAANPQLKSNADLLGNLSRSTFEAAVKRMTEKAGPIG
jgi:hypothetical protein